MPSRALARWEPIIVSVVAAARREKQAETEAHEALAILNTSEDWAPLVAVLQQVMAGERIEQQLAALDSVSTAIAREVLDRLEDRR